MNNISQMIAWIDRETFKTLVHAPNILCLSCHNRVFSWPWQVYHIQVNAATKPLLQLYDMRMQCSLSSPSVELSVSASHYTFIAHLLDFQTSTFVLSSMLTLYFKVAVNV